MISTGYNSTADTAGDNDDRIPLVLTSGNNSAGNDFLDTEPGAITGQVVSIHGGMA